MTSPSSTLVIYDLVSTLTDAGPRYAQAFQDALADRGIAPPRAEEVLEMLGNNTLSEIIDRFAPMPDPQAKKDLMNACNRQCDALLHRAGWVEGLYPGVHDALREVQRTGMRQGIFTGTREDAMAQQLAYHNIKDFFDPAYMRGKDNTRDAGLTVAQLKEKQVREMAAAFRRAAGSGARVILVGDSAADIAVAKKLGVECISFAASAKKIEKLEQVGADRIITDFALLPDMLCGTVKANAPKPPRP